MLGGGGGGPCGTHPAHVSDGAFGGHEGGGGIVASGIGATRGGGGGTGICVPGSLVACGVCLFARSELLRLDL